MNRVLSMLVVLLFCAGPVIAQEDTDAEGCSDSKTLTRMRGCIITECSKKDYDSAEIFTAPEQDKKSVEGEVEIIQYKCSQSLSGLMIARNVEAAMKAQGYSTTFSAPGQNNFPAATLRKGNNWVSAESDDYGYKLTVVRSKEMEQQVVASADEMEAEITRSGQCSIYGILFDTAKATIQPESEKCLKEVSLLLKKNEQWKMRIEGHTDNVGGKEANLKLSQSRADAVRAWLVAHGIAAARLTASGLGDTKPVADNATESGRAKNRRVALVKP